MEKAYKLLAKQEGISNRAAKDLIDRGVVYSGGRKITVARGELSVKAKFRVEKIENSKVIFEDDKILAVNKPAFVTTQEVAKSFDAVLLHRLDKETSGVLLFTKDEDFHKEAVKAFKNKKVYKEYIAIVQGKLVEKVTVDKPLITIKKGSSLFSKISDEGKEAITHIEPLMLEGKLSKVKVIIETGRTHQIRVHCQAVNFPIIGDRMYGKKVQQVNRMLLHSKVTRIFHYEFIAEEPKEFYAFGF